MTKSKAAIEANRRYEDKAYDRILVLLPKGTKDKIKATGATVNGFINRAVLKELGRIDDHAQGE